MNAKKKAGNLLLGKQAEKAQLKQYFTKVLELAESGKEFPISLDDVWPLVYNRKEEAVRALKQGSMFTEGFDYQVLRRNAERSYKDTKGGGHNKLEYMMSVSAMEFFIAKKVNVVFDVYRKVFHRAHKQIKSEQNSIDAIKSQINKKGYIDARDIPYATMQINEKNIRVLQIQNTVLYNMTDVDFAMPKSHRFRKVNKTFNAKTKNAVKCHIFGGGIMWFVTENGKNLMLSQQNMIQPQQLQLNFGGQS